MNHPYEEQITVHVRPDREELIRSCCESLGYRTETVTRQAHGDTEILFRPETPIPAGSSLPEEIRSLLRELDDIDRTVDRYFLKRDVLVGMAGAASIGASFVMLHYDQQVLFVIFLALGIFGCTIPLYLRPYFTRKGMEKYGRREPEILAEIETLLQKDGGED